MSCLHALYVCMYVWYLVRDVLVLFSVSVSVSLSVSVCIVSAGVVAAAQGVLSAGPYYPGPLVGPIVAGVGQGSPSPQADLDLT